MKKVSGYVHARPIGEFNFEFYVPEDTTHEQIRDVIKHRYECYITFETEDGYEEITGTVTRYEKK